MNFKEQDVSTEKKVVAKVSTPIFEPRPGVVPTLSDVNGPFVAGFLEAAEWLQANGEENGLQAAIDLITAQNATNMKNSKRSEFNKAPSKQGFLNKAYDEFQNMDTDAMMKFVAEWKPKGGLPEWAKMRAGQLEQERKDRKKQLLAEAPEATGDSNDESND